jgi:hypothetical protein
LRAYKSIFSRPQQQGHHYCDKTSNLKTQQNGPSNTIPFTTADVISIIICRFQHLSTVAMRDALKKMPHEWQLEIIAPFFL